MMGWTARELRIPCRTAASADLSAARGQSHASPENGASDRIFHGRPLQPRDIVHLDSHALELLPPG